ncbi:T9SS type A sorting domain-containing protein [Soonwooa buanensis]|nr:T9SS type A sorting domain-containing protein [Soonwooa buanensis]
MSLFANKTNNNPKKAKPIANYCTPNVSDPEALTWVSIGTINNRTAATSAVGYEDFTSMSTDLGRYKTYEIKLQGNTEGNYKASFTVFIDFNHDGILGPQRYDDLEGKKERFEIGTITNSTGTDDKILTATITIPGSALEGVTRMRVMKRQTTATPVVYATSGCDLGNTYGQVEDYTINIINPQGCDSAVNGSNLTNAFVPKNVNDYQTITTSAKTGAYTDVFVMEGVTYDFKISKTGVFSTIKDASTGSTYRTATEQDFSWLSSVTGYIRWYTHAGEDCSADSSTFTESVKPSLQTNPLDIDCATGIPAIKGFFNLENAGSNAQELAFDIQMLQGKTSTIKGINLTMADTTGSINFEELNDQNGLPGSLISTINGTVESKTLAYVRDGKSFYNYKIIFDKPVIADITLGTRKWLKLITDAAYVEVNPIFQNDKKIAYKNTVTTDWQINNDFELVYQLIAQCQQDMCTQVVLSGDDPTDGALTGDMLAFSLGLITQSLDIIVEPNKQLKVNGIELGLTLLGTSADLNTPRVLDLNLRSHDATLQEPSNILKAKLPYTFTRELVEEIPLDETSSFYIFKVKVLFDETLVLDGSQSTTYWLELATNYYATMASAEISSYIGMPAFTRYMDAVWVKQDFEVAYNLLTDCSTLETQNPIKQEKTKVYPVPFVNTLTVNSATQIRTIEIFNLAGAKTLQKEVNQSKIDLELSTLPVGIYVVKITDVNGKVDVQKVIKK